MAYDDDISGMMGSNYLRAADLPLDRRFRAIIHQAVKEEVGPDRTVKAVLTLVNPQGQAWKKPLVVNKTGLEALAKVFGIRLRAWTGQTIMVWAELVKFGPKLVPGLKFEPVAQPYAGALAPPPATVGPAPGPQPNVAGSNGAAPPPATVGPAPGPVVYPPSPAAADLDDEIPF